MGKKKEKRLTHKCVCVWGEATEKRSVEEEQKNHMRDKEGLDSDDIRREGKRKRKEAGKNKKSAMRSGSLFQKELRTVRW